jgi:aspartyl-tRNA(Asn)/glutamyl-tRNA(Gln) amidotransferase subunit B
MSEYNPTIGLEIHAELKTRTKMFCDSLNDPDPRSAGGFGEASEKHPNVNVCPVCLAHPGTLPVINKLAVEYVIKVGLALGGKINDVTKFDRKNYFYPDLPKGYQISQYDKPLVEGGKLLGVQIRRIHLEEDTGTLAHSRDEGRAGRGEEDVSLVDFNRAGVPLMELVTEPDFRSAGQVVDFARELQLIFRYLGVSEANMEKGEMRIEANVSLNMGTYVELKNINSFRAVHDAVAYELKRQEEALANGETLKKETRGWDEAKQKTVSQRSKEEAHDYRYFPEPDLPPFETKTFGIEALRDSLPELPAQKRVRFAEEYGLNDRQIEILIGDPEAANFFESATSELWEEPRESGMKETGGGLLFNYLTSDLRGLMNQNGTAFADLKITPEHLAHLVSLLYDKKITTRQAKDMLAKMFETGADPEDIVKSENIGVVSDADEIKAAVIAVIAEHHAAVADYKKGKTASLQFLIGKAMGILKGRAKPEVLKEIFERLLR